MIISFAPFEKDQICIKNFIFPFEKDQICIKNFIFTTTDFKCNLGSLYLGS